MRDWRCVVDLLDRLEVNDTIFLNLPPHLVPAIGLDFLVSFVTHLLVRVLRQWQRQLTSLLQFIFAKLPNPLFLRRLQAESVGCHSIVLIPAVQGKSSGHTDIDRRIIAAYPDQCRWGTLVVCAE